jgi:hypothetical protein
MMISGRSLGSLGACSETRWDREGMIKTPVLHDFGSTPHGVGAGNLATACTLLGVDGRAPLGEEEPQTSPPWDWHRPVVDELPRPGAL